MTTATISNRKCGDMGIKASWLQFLGYLAQQNIGLNPILDKNVPKINTYSNFCAKFLLIIN